MSKRGSLTKMLTSLTLGLVAVTVVAGRGDRVVEALPNDRFWICTFSLLGDEANFSVAETERRAEVVVLVAVRVDKVEDDEGPLVTFGLAVDARLVGFAGAL